MQRQDLAFQIKDLSVFFLFSFMTRISPIILLVIVILSIAFFVLGLIQLLIRCLMKRPSFSLNSHSNTFQESSTYSQAFQSQLQHLFRLHDSGLDRAVIDALPVFYYKDIVLGSKDLFDCAICLCEFVGADKLKFLPNCTHAFHIQCIETWLLSNSTCPLCRSIIGINNMNSPLSSFCDSTGQWDLSCPEGANGSFSQERVFSVRLGTFQNSNESVSSSGGGMDARRCYSMGAFQYIVEDADLQVSLYSGPICGGEKIETQSAVEPWNDHAAETEKKINPKSKIDSYSVSKIWLWSKNSKFSGLSDDASENVVVLPMPERSDLV